MNRFLIAQETSYATALEELKEGKKVTHWIWFVFPQLKGLGSSPMSQMFGLSGLAEARRYLVHPVLGARLRESTDALLSHSELGTETVLGGIDALKVRSSLTLFAKADPVELLFKQALERLYSGRMDMKTVELLDAAHEV